MIEPAYIPRPYVRPAEGAEFFPLVAISILNWNGWQETLECLESIRKLEYPNYLTVVVDNGSSNDSSEKIKVCAKENLGPDHLIADYTRETALAGGDPEIEQGLDRTPSSARIVLIRNEENLGFTGGNNVAIQYALSRLGPADYVFLLNNDAIVEPNCLSELVLLAEKSGAGLVGAKLRNPETLKLHEYACSLRVPVEFVLFSPLLDRFAPCGTVYREDTDCLWVSGAAMLASAPALRALYKSLGRYLNPDLFMYHEEMDLAIAMRRAGFRTLLSARAVACHGRRRGDRPGPHVYYYNTRNRVLIARRLLSAALRPAFYVWGCIYSATCSGILIIRGQRGSAAAMIEGLFDGFRGRVGAWERHKQMPARRA